MGARHAGLGDNEWTDREARKATMGRKVREEDGKRVSLAAEKARILGSIQDPLIFHARFRAVYHGSRSKVSFTRKEAVLMAQLRAATVEGSRRITRSSTTPPTPHAYNVAGSWRHLSTGCRRAQPVQNEG